MAKPTGEGSAKSQREDEESISSKESDVPVESDSRDDEGSDPSTDPEQPSQTKLVEQASRFLEHEGVRHETADKQVAFLKDKGLQDEDIKSLLQSQRANQPDQAPAGLSVSQEQSSPSGPRAARTKPREERVSQEPAEDRSQQPPWSVLDQTRPIITYPEFLVHASSSSQKPPPLVTISRLLALFNVSAASYAALYGADAFVVGPKLAALGQARHELFGRARTGLAAMNAKLEASVSVVPPRAVQLARAVRDADGEGKGKTASKKKEEPKAEEREQEDDSTAERLERYFHRDVGVQTSPPAPPPLESPSSAPSASPSSAGSPSSLAKAQELRARLAALWTSSEDALYAAGQSGQRATELQKYLEDLALHRRMKGALGSSAGKNNDGQKQQDELARLRAEIKSVKGVLLSARSFPRGVPGGIVQSRTMSMIGA